MLRERSAKGDDCVLSLDRMCLFVRRKTFSIHVKMQTRPSILQSVYAHGQILLLVTLQWKRGRRERKKEELWERGRLWLSL